MSSEHKLCWLIFLHFCGELITHHFSHKMALMRWKFIPSWEKLYVDTKTLCENRRKWFDKPTRMKILESHRESSRFSSPFCVQTKQHVFYHKIIYVGDSKSQFVVRAIQKSSKIFFTEVCLSFVQSSLSHTYFYIHMAAKCSHMTSAVN